MNPDLDRLIRLQQLETTADDARRKIADHPARTQALDARLQTARDARRRRQGAADRRAATSGGPKRRKSRPSRPGWRSTRTSCSK